MSPPATPATTADAAVSRWRVPAEWEPHERTLMAWPCRAALWGPLLGEARLVYAHIARTIARYEPVLLVAPPGSGTEAQALAGPAVEVVEAPLDDSWMRDSGPIVTVDDTGDRLGLDFRFNGWGERFTPYDADDALAARLLDRLGIDRRRIDVVLEGGSVALDGAGTVVTTEQCLLHPRRNPRLDRAGIEAALRDALGVTRVVWLGRGLVEDTDTDGHVDNLVAFAAPGLALFQGCADPADPNAAAIAANRRALEQAGIEVATFDVLPTAVVGGERRAVPYANLYVANGAVVVPVTGHPYDAEALAVVAGCFPGREVLGVPGTVLAAGGGGPHCITQQVPAPLPRPDRAP